MGARAHRRLQVHAVTEPEKQSLASGMRLKTSVATQLTSLSERGDCGLLLYPRHHTTERSSG